MKQPGRDNRTPPARPKRTRAENFAAWLARKTDEDVLTAPVTVEEYPWNK